MDNPLFDKQSSLYSDINCTSTDLLETFSKKVGDQLWKVNALLVVDAILAAAIVGIGAYGQRFRHHPLIRFIFLGATTLFLTVISYVVSTTSASFNSYFFVPGDDHRQQGIMDALAASCYFDPFHLVLVITWAFLVQLAAINTSVIVAADDREADRNIGPPFELFVQGVWTFYLGVSAALENPTTSDDSPTFLLQCLPFALVSAKMLLKCYAFQMARRSIALGRNPRLISGYMQQLHQQEHSEVVTPHSHLPSGSSPPHSPLPSPPHSDPLPPPHHSPLPPPAHYSDSLPPPPHFDHLPPPHHSPLPPPAHSDPLPPPPHSDPLQPPSHSSLPPPSYADSVPSPPHSDPLPPPAHSPLPSPPHSDPLPPPAHSPLPSPPHSDPLPPPLLVMGEEGREVDKQPHGYVFEADNSRTTTKLSSLITVDKIWQLNNNRLPMSSPQQLKDLCLSFALFKLLRCRFARYELSNIGSVATHNFFWSFLLKKDEKQIYTTRVFGVIADEVSFLHDYYYTSLPISYSKGCWLPILSVCISLLSIGYCLLIALLRRTVDRVQLAWLLPDYYGYQIACNVFCINDKLIGDKAAEKIFGSMMFDLVPVYLLFLLVVMSEVRDISSYICSNWTKVAIICSYVGRPSSHPCRPTWTRLLLRCECKKLMKHWDGKIGQRSVLVLHQRTTTLFSRLRLPSQKTKVKLSKAVKVCIVDSLSWCNSNGRQLSNGTSSLSRTQAGQSLLWAFSNSKVTSDIILAWQIATRILEVRYPPQQHDPTPSISDYRIAAIHLSRYCVYLVTSCPELLPDDDAWSKRLYKTVSKDAIRALANHHDNLVQSTTPEAEESRKLVAALDQESNHEVLRKGARLGRELMIEGEKTAWELLGGFWSEMILYVAPSNNLKGHSEAIARGGEFITLLWALLFHAGIVDRPGEAGGTTGVV